MAAGSTAFDALKADVARRGLRRTSRSPTSWTAWCGSSRTWWTRSSPTTRWPPARPPRTRRSQLKGSPFTTEYYGVAVKLGNTDLVRRVNQVLVDYRDGGDNSPWMKAYHQWLAADLPGITGPPAPKYRAG